MEKAAIRGPNGYGRLGGQQNSGIMTVKGDCEAMQVLEVGDLPPELTCQPLGFVALTGLDISSSTTHKAIWDTFSLNRRTDRVSLSFALFLPDHEFPKAKPKKTSYDWYVPKGILKTRWLWKHQHEVPAVVVLFYDLEWDDPNWNDKRVECVARVDAIRSTLQGRNTKIAVVLIQKNAPLPGTDDAVATERAAALCSACDLSAKFLFVLPYTDHLYGYVLRLESAFYDFAQTYYQQEIKRIKSRRDILNKTTHQLLFVRHQFKIAFMNELKQDTMTSLKHYKQAYANLMEVRASDANMLEVKTIAGFINYKICRLSFLGNTPLDAISHFRRHIDILKSKTGQTELAFEHSAWLSKQFCHFGDLFDDAVKQGLSAIQTQHPGFYYQQAASHAQIRRQMCQKLCSNAAEYPEPDPLIAQGTLEFYGQRPWRAGSQSLEPLNQELENAGIKALQYKEAHTVNHSTIILSLLSSAVAQFKKFRCPRMKRQLMVTMAEEYFTCNEYSKALTLLNSVLRDYRTECWPPIISSVLMLALKCSYLSASITDFLLLGLESIGNFKPGIQCSVEEKRSIQENVMRVLKMGKPQPLQRLSQDEISLAEELWEKKLASQKEPLIFPIEMKSVVPFVECKTAFASESFYADQRVTLNVYIRTNCHCPITFTKMAVHFTNQYYNDFCEINCDEENGLDVPSEQLSFQPKKVRLFTFTFLPHVSDINHEIKVSSVVLQLGNESQCCAVLHWKDGGGDSGFPVLAWNNLHLPTSSCTKDEVDDMFFREVCLQSTTRIVPRRSKIAVQIEHEPPVLTDEMYPILVKISNEEIHAISSVCLSISLQEGHVKDINSTTHFSYLEPTFNGQYISLLKDQPVEKMGPGEKVDVLLFMKAGCLGIRTVVITVSYVIEVEADGKSLSCCCSKEVVASLETITPFTFSFRLLNMKFQPVQRVLAEEPFVMNVDIKSLCPLTVILQNSFLELADSVHLVDKPTNCLVTGIELQQNFVATDGFCLTVPEFANKNQQLGNYHLQWKRISKITDKIQSVQVLINLPSVMVRASPLTVNIKTPACGLARTPLPVTYRIINHSKQVQEVTVYLDYSDAFMYAGNKQMHCHLLPRTEEEFTYNLYPLLAGFVPLPKLRVILNPMTPQAQEMDDLIDDLLPSHMFIMPQEKGCSSSYTSTSTTS